MYVCPAARLSCMFFGVSCPDGNSKMHKNHILHVIRASEKLVLVLRLQMDEVTEILWL